jgi:hypothetical protein
MLTLALAGAVLPVLPAAAAPQAKAAKKAAQYQDHPKDGKMCGQCRFFIAKGGKPGEGMMGGGMGPGKMADGTCQIVAGAISPMGWCQFYAPLKA